jgi:hypothetical protein
MAFVFLAVVVSPINFLEITPVRTQNFFDRSVREVKLSYAKEIFTSQLFFLGSTLIFIGFDLLYEWIVEVRHKVG